MAEAAFREWAIVELMGYRRLAGLVGEVEIAGAKFLRIDVPAEEPAAPPKLVQYVPPARLYALTLCPEAVARAAAQVVDGVGVLERQLLPPAVPADDDLEQTAQAGSLPAMDLGVGAQS